MKKVVSLGQETNQSQSKIKVMEKKIQSIGLLLFTISAFYLITFMVVNG